MGVIEKIMMTGALLFFVCFLLIRLQPDETPKWLKTVVVLVFLVGFMGLFGGAVAWIWMR